LDSLCLEDVACLLLRSLYGLKQSGRQWNLKLKEVLEPIGLVPIKSDPCIFIDESSSSTTFLLTYVDDINIAFNDPGRVEEIKAKLASKFKIKDLGRAKYCLGIEINQEGNQIMLSQGGYIREVLDRFGMTNCKAIRTSLAFGSKLMKSENVSLDSRFPYKQLIGALMYLETGTRPDIAHAMSVLGQYNDCFDESHWSAKRILRYLKKTINYGLTFT